MKGLSEKLPTTKVGKFLLLIFNLHQTLEKVAPQNFQIWNFSLLGCFEVIKNVEMIMFATDSARL